jgi:thioredoxin 1
MGINIDHLPFFLETSQLDFDSDVINVEGFSFVVFYRDSCGACKVFEPVLNDFSRRNSSKLRFVRVAVSFDNDDDFKFKHGIKGEPTSIIYYNGKRLFDVRGSSPEPYLTQVIQAALHQAHSKNMCPFLTIK